jgi:hypothetical protein
LRPPAVDGASPSGSPRLVGVEDRLHALGVDGGRLDVGALDLQQLADSAVARTPAAVHRFGQFLKGMLARRIGTPTSRPSPTSSCNSRKPKSAGSCWPLGRPLTHRLPQIERLDPGLDPHRKDLGERHPITALVQLCTSLAIVPAPIGPI